ncbi:MAG: hypothetical protein ACLGJD_13590 [Gammaproteobacteria bacterium]
MAADKQLFHPDEIAIAGAPIAFEDASAMITGAARFENTVVPSGGNADDFASRRRVPTTVQFKLQFGPNEHPMDYASIVDAPITFRDRVSGRRAFMPRCGFGSLGQIGGGTVDVTFNVLSPIQWL